MTPQNHISDQALPTSQNFKLLKAKGFDFIQAHSGMNWTNLNESDPGVTILEQVCYALTELGYCAGFPIQDLLTKSDGQIAFNDQFYNPSEILTTTPITISDYRKFIIDCVEGVSNVWIEVSYPKKPYFHAVYQIFLQLDDTIEIDSVKVCTDVYYRLNSVRNLGNTFQLPEVFTQKKIDLNGKIYFEETVNLKQAINILKSTTAHYIFPNVNPISIDQALKEGYSINEIFDGPLLKNGVVLTEMLSEKLNEVTNLKVSNTIQGIKSVSNVTALQFGTITNPTFTATSHENELLVFDWEESIKNNELEIFANGHLLDSKSLELISESRAVIQSPVDNSTFEDKTKLSGNFRDVNTYYSIQNTFPELYGIGAGDHLEERGVTAAAQARQLKGYLTLFDQVMANQFSQLNNLDALFSFKNPTTGTPSDLENFIASKNRLETISSTYPVPYQAFSPTYFYQSLYQIPSIKPLLKDHDVLRVGQINSSNAIIDAQSWQAYQQDPYNSYIHGLMNLMIDEEIDVARRNKILNHLLARHGVMPEDINTIIKGSQYTGNFEKDQIIFKSLYLQNFGLLSYYQPKAYNFLGAAKLQENSFNVLENKWDDISNDFIFNSDLVNTLEKITEQDFINHSSIELKMSLLFGLKPLLKEFIVENDISTTVENLLKELELNILKLSALSLVTQILTQIELIIQHINDGSSFEGIVLELETLNVLLKEKEKTELILIDIVGILKSIKLEAKTKIILVRVEELLVDIEGFNSVQELLIEFEISIGIFQELMGPIGILSDLEVYLLKVLAEIENHNLALFDSALNWLKSRDAEIEVALWLLDQGNGMLMLETALIWQNMPLKITLKDLNATEECYWESKTELQYSDCIYIDRFIKQSNIDYPTQQDSFSLEINDDTYQFEKKTNSFSIKKLHVIDKTESTELYLEFLKDDLTDSKNKLLFDKTLLFLLPDFIDAFSTPEYKARLKAFFCDSLPVELTYNVACVSANEFKKIINIYIGWFNSLCYHKSGPETNKVESFSFKMAEQLPELKWLYNA